MNAPVQDRDDPARVREEIAQIVGCRMVDGVCVKHQSRPWEPRRSGCPYVDSLMRYAGYPGHHDGPQRAVSHLLARLGLCA